MEDFIVISDDSGSESSAGTRSGRARRLRRALSRTPGALPRRTVVSKNTAARHARREPSVAPSGPRRCGPGSPPPCLPAFGGLGPRGARRRRWQGRPTRLCSGAGRAHGRHTEHQCELPSGGWRWPPARTGPRALAAGGVGVLARPQPPPKPRGERAGARNCLACDGHRCVQGGNRSPRLREREAPPLAQWRLRCRA